MRIGVISDTHGLLRPEALACLDGVDHILHAGDIGRPDILPALAKIAPVVAIRGNIDTEDWAAGLPQQMQLTFAGQGIMMIHDLKDLGTAPKDVSVIISGHSHKPSCTWSDGILYLNPGSAGRRRFKLPVTLAILTLGPGIEAEIVTLV
ncbi:metallophosphoesterase family protein [Palleronia abyssalis]|uniref:Phosphoesterase n=1 Tax=Palleronia abyssalis TaxID=1501240 RepID=A0A2R8BUR5_9RHOB|nr:metallophosphoesterase family protein [Palleronia abyssalis]SPJ23863.1 hypothetical protein PAA8504_01682 [Palleronia abyssalis]